MVNVRKLNETIAELESEVDSIKKVTTLIERIDNITEEQKVSVKKITDTNKTIDKIEKSIAKELGCTNEKMQLSLEQLQNVISETKVKYDELKNELIDSVNKDISSLAEENIQHLSNQEKMLIEHLELIQKEMDISKKEICLSIDDLNKQISQLYIKHDQDTDKLSNLILELQNNQNKQLDKIDNLSNQISKIQNKQNIILIGIGIIVLISTISIFI